MTGECRADHPLAVVVIRRMVMREFEALRRLCLSPVRFCLRAKPSHSAHFRLLRKQFRSGAKASIANAVIGSTPCMVSARRAASTMASASETPFGLSTNSLTVFGAISRTVWPSFSILRPHQWAIAQASIATVRSGCWLA